MRIHAFCHLHIGDVLPLIHSNKPLVIPSSAAEKSVVKAVPVTDLGPLPHIYNKPVFPNRSRKFL